MFCMIKEEVKEANNPAAEALFVEIFNDKESFIGLLVANIRKADEVEQEMCGGIKRTMSMRDDIEEERLNKDEDPAALLNKKVKEVLDKFDGESLVVKTRFFRFQKGRRTHVGIAHPRIQKKAGELSFNCDFKQLKNIDGNPFEISTGNGVFTNLDSDQIYGRGNIGPSQCTLIPLKSLDEDNRKRLLHTISQEEEEEEEETGGGGSQDFPFTQSKGKDTLKICDICMYRSMDKTEFEEHRKIHYRCEVCGKRFREKNELMEHNKVHIKMACNDCNEEIQADKMEGHTLNHMKLKTFNRNKATMVTKKEVKPKTVTAYILWQKEERIIIALANPNMTWIEISSELGKKWKMVDKKTKDKLKSTAKEYNSKNTVKTIEIDEHEEANIEDNNDDNKKGEEIIVEEVNNLLLEDDKHEEDEDYILGELSGVIKNVSNKNSATLDNMKQNEIRKCEKCNVVFITEHCSNCEKVANEQPKLKDHTIRIVLAKMKTSYWPCEVISQEGTVLKVKNILDETIITVNETEVKPFDIQKLGETKDLRLRKAFAKAQHMLKNCICPE